MGKDEEQLVEVTDREIALMMAAIPVLIIATICLGKVLGIPEFMI